MEIAKGTKPLASVIVPAHNAEATIAESLSSALASSYGDFELLVIDDGSSDGTARIAEEFARADARVRVHRRPQGGVSAALNLGLQHARGDYVARLDSDDLWHPAKLEKQMAIMAADPAVALVYTFVRYVDADGLVVHDGPPQRFPRRALARMAYSGLVGGNSSVLMRRSCAVKAGGYDESLRSWEDLLLYLSVAADHPIGIVPEYLVGYRVRPGSLSADARNMLDSWRLARRKIEQRFGQVPTFVHRWGHGRRTAELAEAFASRGHYLASARLLLEAMMSDPAWTSTFLAYRLARSLGGKVQSGQGPTVRFGDCDPARPYKARALDEGAESRRLRSLESRRARTLDRVDARLASRA